MPRSQVCELVKSIGADEDLPARAMQQIAAIIRYRRSASILVWLKGMMADHARARPHIVAAHDACVQGEAATPRAEAIAAAHAPSPEPATSAHEMNLILRSARNTRRFDIHEMWCSRMAGMSTAIGCGSYTGLDWRTAHVATPSETSRRGLLGALTFDENLKTQRGSIVSRSRAFSCRAPSLARSINGSCKPGRRASGSGYVT